MSARVSDSHFHACSASSLTHTEPSLKPQNFCTLVRPCGSHRVAGRPHLPGTPMGTKDNRVLLLPYHTPLSFSHQPLLLCFSSCLVLKACTGATASRRLHTDPCYYLLNSSSKYLPNTYHSRRLGCIQKQTSLSPPKGLSPVEG